MTVPKEILEELRAQDRASIVNYPTPWEIVAPGFENGVQIAPMVVGASSDPTTVPGPNVLDGLDDHLSGEIALAVRSRNMLVPLLDHVDHLTKRETDLILNLEAACLLVEGMICEAEDLANASDNHAPITLDGHRHALAVFREALKRG